MNTSCSWGPIPIPVDTCNGSTSQSKTSIDRRSGCISATTGRPILFTSEYHILYLGNETLRSVETCAKYSFDLLGAKGRKFNLQFSSPPWAWDIRKENTLRTLLHVIRLLILKRTRRSYICLLSALHLQPATQSYQCFEEARQQW
jgi:hypothetical protein